MPEGSGERGIAGLPLGGATGEVLTKASGDDLDTEWAAGGGGGGVANPLTEDLDTDGFAIFNDTTAGNVRLFLGDATGDTSVSLESDLDIAILTPEQDINIEATTGAVNITTDPDEGGSGKFDVGGTLSLSGRGIGGVAVSATATHAAVFGATYVDIASGEGADAAEMRMLANGATWWTLAPLADGDIGAGSFGFWFDPSNGAAKLKFKGKTNDGTVVTAEIPMA